MTPQRGISTMTGVGNLTMQDEVTSHRVMTIAAGAGVQLDATTAERVARAVSPSVTRFSAERIRLPLEVEPATFVVTARKELRR